MWDVNYRQITRSRTIDAFYQTSEQIYAVAQELLDAHWESGEPVRLSRDFPVTNTNRFNSSHYFPDPF